jgi:hypothetical protein
MSQAGSDHPLDLMTQFPRLGCATAATVHA